jgi:hypothetical protein
MTGSPLVTAKPALGIATLSEKALDVMCWHPVQWQAAVRSGGALTKKRTAPQRHPPSQGRLHSVMIDPFLFLTDEGACPRRIA